MLPRGAVPGVAQEAVGAVNGGVRGRLKLLELVALVADALRGRLDQVRHGRLVRRVARGAFPLANGGVQRLPPGRLLIYFGGASPKPEGMGLPAGIAIDTTSLPYFQQFVSKDFQPEYLLFVANQFGPQHKIGVYAFGNSELAKKAATTRAATTRAATQPTEKGGQTTIPSTPNL